MLTRKHNTQTPTNVPDSMSRAAQFIKNLQKFRLITFDVTDTLLLFKKPPNVQYADTAAKLGITGIDQEVLTKCFSKEFKRMSQQYPNFACNTPQMSWEEWWLELVRKVFCCAKPNIPTDRLDLLANTLLRIFRTSECWEQATDADVLVLRMRDANKCLGIISNSDPSLRQVLAAMDLEHRFDFVLTSYDVGVQKPDRRIFDIALEQARCKPHEALHIGNIYQIDYMGARNSGWSSLLVSAKTSMDTQTAHDTHTHTNLTDMLQALETKDIIWT